MTIPLSIQLAMSVILSFIYFLLKGPRGKANVRPVKKPAPKKRLYVKAFAAPKHKAMQPVQKRTAHPPASSASNQTLVLDFATATALEAELQQVMIEVWQQLPDEASTAEESTALEIMRNEVSDDLKDAKRLLKTFNPLNVKVHFSTKPQRQYLSLFLKRYNFVVFKRIVTVTNSFAAQVKTIADYDDLCSNKKIFCGTAKITITPCYRFTQCPKNLKTVYGSPLDDTTASFKKCSEKVSETSGTASKGVVVKNEKTIGDDDNTRKKQIVARKSNQVENKSTENVAKSVEKIANNATQTTVTESNTTTKKTINVPKTNAAIETKIDTTATKTALGIKIEQSAETKNTDKKTADDPIVKSTVATEKTLITKNQAADSRPYVTVTKPTDIKTQVLPTPKATVTPAPFKALAKTTAAKVTPNKAQAQTTPTTVTANKVLDKSTVTTVASDKTPVKPSETKAPAKVTNIIVTPNNPPTKPTETKVADNATPGKATGTIVTPNKTPANKATETVASAKTAQNKAEATNIKVTPNKTLAKPTETKVIANATTAKTTEPKITPNKIIANKAAKTNANAEPAQNKAKVAATTKPSPKKTSASNKNQANAKNALRDDDFEELDDHGLYLYLSAGIVLDECSGSDDE